jgi:hypothetical protein
LARCGGAAGKRRWKVVDGREEKGDGSWEIGDGSWEIADNVQE